MADKSHGSGYFGEWITDGFGLPAYRYTCNQVSDPKAVAPTNPLWRAPTDHSHQVGNDRLVAVCSNYGYVQVRQDEGGPKFLNDYDPVSNRYAGGFGYLTDNVNTLCTFYSGQGNSFERIFGVGYLRKTVSRDGLTADQVIFAPFGDDPLVISQVEISNRRDTPADLRWIEYWGCQHYPFSYRAQIVSFISRGKASVPGFRRQFAARFAQRFAAVEGKAGLLNTKRFRGYSLNDRLTWGLDRLLLATVGRKAIVGGIRPPAKEASLEDLSPLPTFLVSLDAPADGLATDAGVFFGTGGVGKPDGIGTVLSAALPPGAGGSALLLERRVYLEPGEKRTLYFAYGYLPQGHELAPLLARYREDLSGQWGRSSAAWKRDRIRLDIPGESWVDRELTWHNYYLRSNLTYDSFFQEHILSQGHVYQYLIGFQGAARDPLQHALPFTFSCPQIVREVLRYTLKEVLPDGEIPYGRVGQGMRMPAPAFRPSDLEMWLLWLASEYVLATRDLAFLDAELPTYPIYGPKAGRATVRSLLARCYQHLSRTTGTGRHGLMRMSNGDWNDGAVLGFVPKESEKEVREVGESVLNAAFATYTLDLYARMLTYADDRALAADVRQWAEAQRQAVREQWGGRWFRRSWLTEDMGWIGEDVLWLEPQPWAIIGGAATSEQRTRLVQAVDELVRKPSPIGAMLLSRSLEQIPTAAGDLTNAAVWPSINGTLIWSLAMVDGNLAWDEWRKNTLAQHTEAYPDIWYGIWSGPDTYNSVLSKYPGHTFFDEKMLQGEASDSPFGSGVNWTDFPVMNMHPHAWPLYDVPKLLGVEFTPEGVELAPALPHDSYRFESPLLGLEKSATAYSGWYAPLVAGEWQIALHLPDVERSRFTRLEVNGQPLPHQRREDGALYWTGSSAPGSPLNWMLT